MLLMPIYRKTLKMEISRYELFDLKGYAGTRIYEKKACVPNQAGNIQQDNNKLVKQDYDTNAALPLQ